ncbi:hypothetical protein ACOSP7_005186 [Xanthoceras sorbifolium]
MFRMLIIFRFQNVDNQLHNLQCRSNSGGSFKSDGSDFKASKSDGGVFRASKADGGHASSAGTSGVSVGTNSGGDQVATKRDAEKLTVADSVSTNLKVAEIGSTPVVIRDMGVAVGEAILVEEVSKGTADVSLPGDSNTVCGIGSVVSSNSFGLPNACDQEDGTEIQVINSPRRKAWKRLARGVSSVRAQSSSGGSNLGKRFFVLADDDKEGQQLKRRKEIS